MRESQESDELALLPKINALLHSQLSVHDLWDFSHTYKNKKPPNWEVFYFLRNCHHNSYPSSDFVSSSPLGEAHHPVASRPFLQKQYTFWIYFFTSSKSITKGLAKVSHTFSPPQQGGEKHKYVTSISFREIFQRPVRVVPRY